MVFTSPYYLFAFLPLVLVLYLTLNRLGLDRLAKAWLVVASLYFYAYWNYAYLFLIVVSILANFGFGVLLHRLQSRAERGVLSAKIVLVGGLVFNLGILGYFKYSDFFIANANALLGTHFTLLNLLLPLAISFFTFQQVAYLVDCYRRDAQEYNLLNYCLFVSFFPQLIAGPIVHHREMMPQFSERQNTRVNWQNVAQGVLIFGIGLFKKVAIADTFAVCANAGFDSHQALGFLPAWGASLSYSLQLYYDFSGYTDMAIGAALMFNIRLPINFNSPYKSLDIREFWRRWHMTLSRWLRDYVYIPLGGNRLGNGRVYFNLMATFVLGGLWHGAGWTFVLWGALHGTALCMHRFWQAAGFRLSRPVAWVVTLLFINFAWVFFRADSVASAMLIVEGMLGLNGFDVAATYFDALTYAMSEYSEGAGSGVWNYLMRFNTAVYIVVFGTVALFAKNSLEIAAGSTRFSLTDVFLVSSSFLLAILLGIATRAPTFLYFNF